LEGFWKNRIEFAKLIDDHHGEAYNGGDWGCPALFGPQLVSERLYPSQAGKNIASFDATTMFDVQEEQMFESCFTFGVDYGFKQAKGPCSFVNWCTVAPLMS
jgi:hypothetical protein